jgi:hypothetical protein
MQIIYGTTVPFRPSVHTLLRVTSSVHFLGVQNAIGRVTYPKSVHFDPNSRIESEQMMSTLFILCLGAWTAQQNVTSDLIGQSTTIIVLHWKVGK